MSEQDGPGDRVRPKPVVEVVDGGIEGIPAMPLEGQLQLDGGVVIEVGDGEPDESKALIFDDRKGRRQQALGGRQDCVSVRGRGRQSV